MNDDIWYVDMAKKIAARERAKAAIDRWTKTLQDAEDDIAQHAALRGVEVPADEPVAEEPVEAPADEVIEQQ